MTNSRETRRVVGRVKLQKGQQASHSAGRYKNVKSQKVNSAAMKSQSRVAAKSHEKAAELKQHNIVSGTYEDSSNEDLRTSGDLTGGSHGFPRTTLDDF